MGDQKGSAKASHPRTPGQRLFNDREWKGAAWEDAGKQGL